MTSQLIKHEYLRTRGGVLLIWAIALTAGIGGTLLSMTDLLLFSQLGKAASILGAVLVIPAVQLYLGIDYWQNSYRGQGYFTQMLPIAGAKIYRAKLWWGMIVSVLSLAVAAIIVVIALAGNSLFPYLGELWAEISPFIPGWLAVLIVIVGVSYLFYLLITLYAMATLGSAEPLNRWGIGGPIVVGVCIYLAMQLLTIISVLAIPLWVGVGPSTGLEIQVLGIGAILSAGSQSAPIGWIPVVLIVPVVLSIWTASRWNRGASLV